MSKILTIFFTCFSLIILMMALKNAYNSKKQISAIKNKKIYHFILLNIAIASLFILFYVVFLSIVFYEDFHIGNLVASILFLLNSIFMYIASIVTNEIGSLLLRLDALRKMDSLTNIYNRHYVERTIEKEFERCIRYERNACLLMIDINNFKMINDKYGHQAGDKVILDLVKTIKQSARKVDILGRYGGDEFIILMPETILAEAKSLSRRLCEMISNKFIHSNGHNITYRISIGISEIKPDYIDYEDWMHTADVNLYNDKRSQAS